MDCGGQIDLSLNENNLPFLSLTSVESAVKSLVSKCSTDISELPYFPSLEVFQFFLCATHGIVSPRSVSQSGNRLRTAGLLNVPGVIRKHRYLVTPLGLANNILHCKIASPGKILTRLVLNASLCLPKYLSARAPNMTYEISKSINRYISIFDQMLLIYDVHQSKTATYIRHVRLVSRDGT